MKIEIPPALAPVKQFFTKHHAVLFISLITLLLSLAVYLLYMATLAKPAEAPVSTITRFDQATVDRIKNLHDSSDSSNKLVFPSPRANPFTE